MKGIGKIETLLFRLLRNVVGNQIASESDFISLSEGEWFVLYKMVTSQGVTAITYDALQPILNLMPRNLKLQWALSAERIGLRYRKQEELAKKLSDLYAANGIRTVVLKGIAVSQYYPVPQYRECGDFDCFLLGDFERGNEIAKQNGAMVRTDDYKHSHINYKGLTVENHKFCTPIRGYRVNKEFEIYLQELLKDKPQRYLADSKMILPSATFNALFLTRHSMTHFLYEGITLRHIMDWALLLKTEQNKIDWEKVYEWCEKMNMVVFLNTLNSIVEEFLGVEINNQSIVTNPKYSYRLLRSVLYENNSVYNRENLSLWSQRWAIVCNMIAGHWKYSKIYQRSMFLELIKAAINVTFDKHPNL